MITIVKFLGKGTGRVAVIDLQRGDLLLESIEEALKSMEIRNAIVTSAIGSLQKAVFHRVTGMEREPADEYVTVESPLELASLQGLVVDGHPHFHMVISDAKTPYTGHLEYGTTVLYLAEITLLEVEGISLKRVKDENNIAILTNKS